MKIECTKENFKKAIFNSERIVSKQSTLPILNNILFETNKEGLKLSATNLEIGVSVQIGAKVEKEGNITIPARLISNFVNNLSQGDNISLETDGQNMKIQSGHTKAVIKGLLADEFPLLPKRSAEYILNIPGLKFKNIISKLITCVALNEARQELSGINIILKEKEILLASTDSFRLFEYKLALEDRNKNKGYLEFVGKRDSLIVPANTFIELARIIPSENESDIKIAIEDSQIFFEVEGTKIVSRLINGKYPEYEHIIPKEFKTKVIGEKNDIQSAIKMASIFSNSKASEIILKIASDKKRSVIEARSVDVGENSSELDLDASGPSQEIVLNAKYLLDGINMVETRKVSVLMNNESSPVAIRSVDEKSGEILGEYIYIVMPIKN